MVSRFGWLVSEVVLELKSKLFSRTLKQNTNQNGMEWNGNADRNWRVRGVRRGVWRGGGVLPPGFFFFFYFFFFFLKCVVCGVLFFIFLFGGLLHSLFPLYYFTSSIFLLDVSVVSSY